MVFKSSSENNSLTTPTTPPQPSRGRGEGAGDGAAGFRNLRKTENTPSARTTNMTNY